jgi:hypothetical protein
MYPVKDTDLAYLAGLIDGEGMVTIAKVRPAPHVVNGNPRYFAKVEIQMSDREPIEHVARLYDRHIMVKKPSANMRKPAYRISWQAKIAADLLEQILPYLVLKRAQALATIEFQTALSAEGVGGNRRAPRTAAQAAMRERYYLELRRLKREGPGGLGC